MEKSNHLASVSFPVNIELPVFRALHVSFEPFALRRPLKLFGAVLRMPIGEVATPDGAVGIGHIGRMDYLVRCYCTVAQVTSGD